MLYKYFLKWAIDFFIALIFMPFFFLMYIPIAIMIKLEDGGPIFYCGERLGRDMVIFKMYKFRSMKVDAPDIRLADGSTLSSKTDHRVTNVGKIIREISIDEIPQILNVLRGDMSIIGPRPDVISDEIYPDEYKSIFNIKPGITGYNQAYFRNDNSRLEKMENDKYYAENLSSLLDIKIFLKTVAIVLQKKNIYRN